MSTIMSLFTMTTGIPFEEAPAIVSGEQQATAKKRPADVFLDFDGLRVPDTATVNRWACAIEEHHNIEIRPIVGVGHHTNIYGCWAIEKFTTANGSGGYERLRLADATQMQEIWEAHKAGHTTNFWELVEGLDIDGHTLPGPYRKDRPPVDAKGQPIEEAPSRGDHGPLPAECEWIESHDETFVEFRGQDVNWPNGCWQVEKSGCPTQYLDAEGIKYVAHNLLGMPTGATKAEVMRRKREATKQKAQGNGIASLFAPQPAPQVAPTGSVASLFAQQPQPEPAPTGVAALFIK
jgi:hypothetical protein